MIVRAARAGESEALSRLARAAKASWGYPQSWMERWRSDLTITDEYLLMNTVLVAEEGGTVTGMVAVELHGVEPELAHLWVWPAAQRTGVGRSLVRAALSRAAAAGVRALRVVSDPNAVPFYMRLGARPAGWLDASFEDVERRLPVLSLPVHGDADENAHNLA